MGSVIMQEVSPQIVSGKKVLLRLDLDVPVINGKVAEDFRLQAGLPTIKLCLEHAEKVILMGHLGRPEGKVVPELSVEPIRQWLNKQGLNSHLTSGKLKLLENLRFDGKEESCDLEYAQELARLGNVYVNEAFAAHHPATSTTVLPTLLPHAAGLRFAQEVRVLGDVRENPKKPFVAIIGGIKVEDKLPAIKTLSKMADAVLVGGKLVSEAKEQNIDLPNNVMLGKLTEDSFDIISETVESWRNLIMRAKMIVWNGPLGKIEDPKNEQSAKIAELVVDSEADTVVGGGDTIALLGRLGLLGKFGFVSVGGGAMVKFLADGTLPTIEALK